MLPPVPCPVCEGRGYRHRPLRHRGQKHIKRNRCPGCNGRRWLTGSTPF
jgi:DnaJ-class molecular chaperone